MFKVISILIIGFFVNSASAASLGVEVYFPGACPGKASKATLLSQPTVETKGNVNAIGFKLTFLECLPEATQFSTYAPVKNEYVEVYPSASDDFKSFNLAILENVVDANSAEFRFEVPVSAHDFHVDVFLYGIRIPYHLTVNEAQQTLTVRQDEIEF